MGRLVITNPKFAEPSPVVAGPAEATPIATKFARLLRETRVWLRAGLPLADKSTRDARLAACTACLYYRAQGNFGLGECAAPGCGCTRAKLYLGTARCPHPQGSRWPA